MAVEAREWIIRGRVQGVGFRWYAQKNASALGLTGFARNLDDGTVRVYAAGAPEQLKKLAAALHHGPPTSDVRGVEEREAAVQQLSSFRAG